MAARRDAGWLKTELVKVLGWDAFIVEGLVDTISNSSDRSEINELVENFLAGDAAAVRIIDDYLTARGGAHGGTAAGAGKAAPGPSYASATRPAAAEAAGSGAAGLEQGWRALERDDADVAQYTHLGKPKAKSGRGSVQDLAALEAEVVPQQQDGAASTSAPGASSRSSPAPPEKVLGMFKQGGKIKLPSGKTAVRRDETALSAAGLERPVVNCLGCGKIYDCRTASPDITRFLERGGLCTFCGAKVALTYRDRQEALDAAAATALQAAEQGAGAKPAPASAAETAVAFKDRLVEYDRNSAKRTAVIDDQSDFFEIDTNAWLSDQEREQLRERRRLEEEAEAVRKRRVTVTIDLIGRKVLLAEDAEKVAADAAEAAKAREAAAAKAAEESSGMGGGKGGAPAMTNTLMASRPETTPEQLARAVAALRDMKIAINPNIVTEAPKFTPGSKASTSGKAPSRRTGPAPAQGGSRRLQDDLAAEFDEFGTEVLTNGRGVALAAEPFDLCPPEYAGMAAQFGVLPPKPGARVVPAAAPPPSGLPPGLVLLKGWISLEDQIKVLAEIRDLGLGPGGFYTPSYADGGQLALRMMCMGQHWEPRTSSYHSIRAHHDGAVAPPIPPFLAAMAQAALKAASAASSVRLPPMVPDVCLANFYEKAGRLGMHQDKDESSESLRRGLPVVSFSLGDAADFIFGTSREVEAASTVRLESGDALVFGGPARMLFHGVPQIHPGTAPAALLERTGLRPGRLNLTFRQNHV